MAAPFVPSRKAAPGVALLLLATSSLTCDAVSGASASATGPPGDLMFVCSVGSDTPMADSPAGVIVRVSRWP